MARMHSRKKGKSGSSKPATKTVPSWVKLSADEAIEVIVKKAKEGMNSSEVGIFMRDEHGIPDIKTLTGKKVGKIFEEAKINSELPEDLLALVRKAAVIRKHLELNHKDETAKRGLLLTESKVRRLTKHHKAAGKLDASWKYNPKELGAYLD